MGAFSAIIRISVFFLFFFKDGQVNSNQVFINNCSTGKTLVGKDINIFCPFIFSLRVTCT